MYATAVVSPGSLLGAAAVSGINQWRDAPSEWGQGGAGYGRRFGYHFAGAGVSNAIQFGVSALRQEDTRYIRCGEAGFWRRVRHAIVHTYVVRNENGGTAFAVSRLIGAYGSALVADTWNPARLNGTGHVVLRGTWSMAGDMGNSAFREFWPDVKRRVFHKH
jgi:hypothetical protein